MRDPSAPVYGNYLKDMVGRCGIELPTLQAVLEVTILSGEMLSAVVLARERRWR
jgi:hypothetical protein